MRWQEGRRSENIEDRRRMSGGPVMMGGGIGMLLLIGVMLLLGADPRALLQQVGQMQQQQRQAPTGDGQGELSPEAQQAGEFVSAVLADTEDVWTEIFRKSGKRYQAPKLVLFTGQVQSACGFASAAMGPFYCPGDSKVYLDTEFFDELHRRFGAPGDFAQAYVIAHEVAHHVQNLLGISDQVHQARARVSQEEYNQLSVRLELQADFLAGVWAHHAHKMRHVLEEGDLEEGLRAASAIGDDKIQKQAQGYVVPDAFTHGSSEQRVRWFKRGLQTGDMSRGETFDLPYDEL